MPDKARGERTTVLQPKRRSTADYRPASPAQIQALADIKRQLQRLASEHSHGFVNAVCDILIHDQDTLVRALETFGSMLRTPQPDTDPPSDTSARPTADVVPPLPAPFRALAESVIKPVNVAKATSPGMQIVCDGFVTDLGSCEGKPALICGGAYVDWEALAALVIAVATRRGMTIAPTSLTSVREDISAACAEQLGGRVTRRALTRAAGLATSPGQGRKTWAEARLTIRDASSTGGQRGDPLAAPATSDSIDAKRAAAILSVWTAPGDLAYPAGSLGHAQAVYAAFKRAVAGGEAGTADLAAQLRGQYPDLFPATSKRRGR